MRRTLIAAGLVLLLAGCDLAVDSPPADSPPAQESTYEGAYEDQQREQGRELTEEWQRQQCQEAKKEGLIPPDFDC
jgi:hypothetical protein